MSAIAKENAKLLRRIAVNPELLEIGREAIEDALIEHRDMRLSALRNNGFVCKEKDGTPSAIIRFGPETGIIIALKAIAAHLESL